MKTKNERFERYKNDTKDMSRDTLVACCFYLFEFLETINDTLVDTYGAESAVEFWEQVSGNAKEVKA